MVAVDVIRYFLAIAIFSSLNWSRVESKLVFPPGSDVGYIVPDAAADRERAEAMMPQIDPQYNDILEHEHLRRKIRGEQRVFNTLDEYNDLWLPHRISETDDLLARKGDGVGREPLPDSLQDSQHGVKMGIADNRCDDAKTNLMLDWDYSPANYTCYNPRLSLPPPAALSLPSSQRCDDVAKNYTPQHFCMDTPIAYPDRVPTHGDHRPLWPQFGEYKFVPVQRWLHNIEHGSVVMLYHPCTRPDLVQQLRELVTGCLYKHIITPFSPLALERPLALVAWGCVLEMASVDPVEVRAFIQQRALKGPEGTLRKQGLFTEGLIAPSEVPEGKLDNDLQLCPTALL